VAVPVEPVVPGVAEVLPGDWLVVPGVTPLLPWVPAVPDPAAPVPLLPPLVPPAVCANVAALTATIAAATKLPILFAPFIVGLLSLPFPQRRDESRRVVERPSV
jgi:hypothetical protein